jgi:hypothetical protein
MYCWLALSKMVIKHLTWSIDTIVNIDPSIWFSCSHSSFRIYADHGRTVMRLLNHNNPRGVRVIVMLLPSHDPVAGIGWMSLAEEQNEKEQALFC